MPLQKNNNNVTSVFGQLRKFVQKLVHNPDNYPIKYYKKGAEPKRNYRPN
jgi:hypothetical protein